MSRTSRIVVTMLGGAVIGLTVFAALVWRAVTIEQADTSEAAQRFAAIRASLGAATPLLDVDDGGRVTRRAPVPVRAPQAIGRLTALAYQQGDQRLVRAEVPFWFFKLKGPAARLALGGTGFDLDRLEITPADLERYGPAVVLDHTRQNGDRLLVWTE